MYLSHISQHIFTQTFPVSTRANIFLLPCCQLHLTVPSREMQQLIKSELWHSVTFTWMGMENIKRCRRQQWYGYRIKKNSIYKCWYMFYQNRNVIICGIKEFFLDLLQFILGSQCRRGENMSYSTKILYLWSDCRHCQCTSIVKSVNGQCQLIIRCSTHRKVGFDNHLSLGCWKEHDLRQWVKVIVQPDWARIKGSVCFKQSAHQIVENHLKEGAIRPSHLFDGGIAVAASRNSVDFNNLCVFYMMGAS